MLCVLGLLTVSGCENVKRLDVFSNTKPEANKATQQAVITDTGAPKSASELDVATKEERQAAIAESTAPEKEKALGKTIASLGSPAQAGFWLKTPLVSEQEEGRVVVLASGQSANLVVMPLEGEGSGSQLSLSAMRLLGLPLMDLVKINVFVK